MQESSESLPQGVEALTMLWRAEAGKGKAVGLGGLLTSNFQDISAEECTLNDSEVLDMIEGTFLTCRGFCKFWTKLSDFLGTFTGTMSLQDVS